MHRGVGISRIPPIPLKFSSPHARLPIFLDNFGKRQVKTTIQSEVVSFPRAEVPYSGRHRRFRLSSCLNLFVDTQGIVLDDVVDGTLDFLFVLSTGELIGSTSDTGQIGAGVVTLALVEPEPGIELGEGIIPVFGGLRWNGITH